jgi:5-carboxymethyl-2-hydroxymuconate isomerase
MAMPHFSIEYSANLDDEIDVGVLCEVVRHAAVQTEIFPLGGIRVRAIRCAHFAVADGRAGLSFLDILLRIGEGRDLAVRQKAGDAIFQAVSQHLEPLFATGRFALSFDIQINDSATSWKRNAIHDMLKAETSHG